jgi:mono/diheme cytochrome c family protein
MRALLLAGLAFIALSSSARAASFPAEQIEQGRQLAVAGDCAACHTAPGGGAAFAGGYAVTSPLGAIYATNITPSKAHGIGGYSEAQFAHALREGIRADGAHLYPAMPYTAYTQLSDTDVHALYAYFMRGVAPVDDDPPRTRLPFPFNLRFSMTVWNALFLKDQRFTPDPSRSARWNRGAYLVGALEHCSVCHSPRGLLMEERKGEALAGGQIGEWHAPNITPDPVSGVGGWSQAELVAYLKRGRVPGKAQAAGGMADAVTHSLSHLPDADLRAITAYLGAVPPVRNRGATRPAFDWGAPATFEAALRGAAPADRRDGAALYSGLCASCHGSTGAGTRDQAYPSLLRNATVGDARPDNLIAVILEGVDRDAGGERTFMPGFGPRSFVQTLSNAQIAVVATYVRTTFGPGGTPITAAEVAAARKGGPISPLLWLARIGVGAVVLIVLALLTWMGMGRRSRQGARQ